MASISPHSSLIFLPQKRLLSVAIASICSFLASQTAMAAELEEDMTVVSTPISTTTIDSTEIPTTTLETITVYADSYRTAGTKTTLEPEDAPMSYSRIDGQTLEERQADSLNAVYAMSQGSPLNLEALLPYLMSFAFVGLPPSKTATTMGCVCPMMGHGICTRKSMLTPPKRWKW